MRNFLFDAFNFLFYTKLSNSRDKTLSALAAKSLKEAKYHLRHSKNWIIRLGDGTNESNQKLQNALDDLWYFTGELFEMDEIDNELLKVSVSVDLNKIKIEWDKIINNTLKSKLERPIDSYMASGGKKGIHTECLGVSYLLKCNSSKSIPRCKMVK